MPWVTSKTLTWNLGTQKNIKQCGTREKQSDEARKTDEKHPTNTEHSCVQAWNHRSQQESADGQSRQMWNPNLSVCELIAQSLSKNVVYWVKCSHEILQISLVRSRSFVWVWV